MTPPDQPPADPHKAASTSYRTWLPSGGRDGTVAKLRRGTIRLIIKLGALPGMKPLANWTMRRMFDGLAPRWDAIRRDPIYRNALERSIDEIPVSLHVSHALDMACGTGLAAEILHDRLPTARIVGADISPEMVRYAQEKLPDVQFTVASADQLPFADGEFDLIVSVDGVFDVAELVRVASGVSVIIIVYTRGGSIPVRRPVAELQRAFAARGCQVVTSTDDGPWIIWAVKTATAQPAPMTPPPGAADSQRP